MCLTWRLHTGCRLVVIALICLKYVVGSKGRKHFDPNARHVSISNIAEMCSEAHCQ